MSARSERIAKNTGFMFVRLLVTVFIGLFTSRVVLQTLGIEDFGLNNLVGGLVVAFSFLQSALNNATSRYLTFDIGKGNLENLTKTFSMTMNSELILSAIIILLAEIIGPWFIANKLVIPEGRLSAALFVYQLSIVNFVIGLILTPYNSLIIAYEHMNFYALTSVVGVVFKLLIVYLLWLIPFDKLYVFAILGCSVTVIMSFWQVYYCRKHFPNVRYIKYWDKGLIKQFLSYSGWSLIVNMTDIAVSQCISIFFNLFKGVVANAAWGVSNQVNQQLAGFLNSFSTSYNPQIIKSYAAKDFEYFYRLIFSASKLSYFLYFGFSFPIIINIHLILKVWLGAPPPMSDVFLLLIILYTIFDSFQYPLITSVHATGYLKVHQPMMACIKLLNIPLSYLLLKLGAPVYSILVVYVSLNALCAVCRTIYLRFLIHLDLKAYARNCLLPMLLTSVVSVAIPIVCYFKLTNGWLLLLASILSFFTIYLPVIYFYALNEAEKNTVKAIVGEIGNKLKNKNYNE